MPQIKISELLPAGSELFQGSENFLNELTDDEMILVEGGARRSVNLKSVANVNINVTANTVFSANGNTIVGNTIGNGVTAVG